MANEVRLGGGWSGKLQIPREKKKKKKKSLNLAVESNNSQCDHQGLSYTHKAMLVDCPCLKLLTNYGIC